MKTRQHNLAQIEGVRGGINSHRTWFCNVNNIEIYSNDDVDGDKFYMTNGEQADTIWYPSPTAAAIAYNQLGMKAVNKTARRYGT